MSVYGIYREPETNLDIPLGETTEPDLAPIVISSRYIYLGDAEDSPLLEVWFVCWASGLYTVTAESEELWSGRNALLAGLEWADISGEFVGLADILLANCDEAFGRRA